MPAVAGDGPKYVGDVWIVEEIAATDYRGESNPLGVFDSPDGAEAFVRADRVWNERGIRVVRSAFYTTKWSNTNEE